jgi:hypothetical protein
VWRWVIPAVTDATGMGIQTGCLLVMPAGSSYPSAVRELPSSCSAPLRSRHHSPPREARSAGLLAAHLGKEIQENAFGLQVSLEQALVTIKSRGRNITAFQAQSSRPVASRRHDEAVRQYQGDQRQTFEAPHDGFCTRNPQSVQMSEHA